MRCATVLLISAFISRSAAADSECSSEGSCHTKSALASSLMQVGSQQRTSVVEVSEAATTFEGLAERISRGQGKQMPLSGVGSLVESVAEKVATQNYKMTPVENEAFETIKSYISQMFVDAEAQHKADVAEIEQARDLISACGNDTQAALAGDVSGLKNGVQTAREEHEACREAEALTRDAMSAACSIYDNYRKSDPNRVPPDCMSTKLTQAYIETSDDAQKAQMEACLEAVQAWFPPLYDKYTPCKAKKDSDTAQNTQCNFNQTKFETSFCSYTSKLEDTCAAQVSCRALMISARTSAHDRVALSADARKADYHAGKHLLCLFKVFEDSNTDKAKTIEDCKALVVDASKFDITYPEIPSAQTCETEPNKVCDAAWVSQEYSSKAWHSKAAAATCQPCPTPTPV